MSEDNNYSNDIQEAFFMEKTIHQFRAVGYNMIAWALIWIIAVLAVPAGLIILLIYGIRGMADKIIRRLQLRYQL